VPCPFAWSGANKPPFYDCVGADHVRVRSTHALRVENQTAKVRREISLLGGGRAVPVLSDFMRPLPGAGELYSVLHYIV
jgi:hypothetical protein